MLELRSNRLTQITDELRKAQAKLDELGHRLSTSQNLLHETEVIAPRLSTRAQWKTNPPVLTVVRARAGRANELTVSETTRLEPGDALKVEIPMPETQQPEFARTVRDGPSAGSFRGGGRATAIGPTEKASDTSN